MIRNVNGLILEGISGTGKSTIVKKLTASKAWADRAGLSSIILSEHQTQRVLEHKENQNGLSVDDNKAVLDHIVDFIESLERNLRSMNWWRRSRTNQIVPFLLERFHFTHVNHYPHMRWKDVESIDRKLSGLNVKVCILVMNENCMEDRIVRAHNRNLWQDYLKRYGDDVESIKNYFMDRQNRLLKIAEKSSLQVHVVDTSDGTVDQIVAEVLRIWNLES